MIDTIIDIEVLKSFYNSKPSTDPSEDSKAWEEWLAFKKFLKEKTNLYLLANCLKEDAKQNYLGDLTTGRGNAKQGIEEASNYNGYQSIYFINKINHSKISKKIKISSLAHASSKDFLELWKNLSFYNKTTSYIVNPKNNKLFPWKRIKEYVTAITDLVIVDPYIFKSPHLLDNNLFTLIEHLIINKKQSTHITIISYVDKDNSFDIEDAYSKMKNYFNNNNLNITLSIVLTPPHKQLHDRYIYSNYFFVYSGNSFNYYKEDNTLKIKESRIEFNSYCNIDYHKQSLEQLNIIKNMIEYMPIVYKKNILGNPKNNRLIYPNN